MRLIALILCGLILPAEARFADVLVQWNGRVMTMDSCARHLLLRFSGRSRASQNLSAADWLANVLFDPTRNATQALFLVEHPDLLVALELPPDPRTRLSPETAEKCFAELHRLGARVHLVPEASRTELHKEVLRLEGNISTYIELTQAFSAYRPEMTVPGFGTRSIAEFRLHEHRLLPALRAIEAGDTEHAEPFLEALQATDGPGFFPIYPGDSWTSPGHLFGEHDTAIAKALWNLVDSHGRDNGGDFGSAARDVRALQDARLRPSVIRRADLETRYHQLRPFHFSKLLYGLAILGMLIGRLPAVRLHSWRPAVSSLVIAGWVLHGLGLVARMVITNRPPVTNLHSTFLFTSWAMVLLAMLLERRHRSGTGWLAAAVSGCILLMVAGRWANEGDSLGVLVAVLDSNFWLSTHVLSITLGYAGVALAGLFGHGVLWDAALGRRPRRSWIRSMDAALRFGLLFTFLGTVLGGIWADQSWGRFWGWDPKENGALLLILWTAILFHGQLAGWLDAVRLGAGCVLGVIVLLFAWLGTNLLGVGLHAYGFTSGVAHALVLACLFELAFVNACLWFAYAGGGGGKGSTTFKAV